MATLAFERPQQMHTAAHLLTGGRTEDFKSFFFFSSSLYFFVEARGDSQFWLYFFKLDAVHERLIL